MRPSYLIAASLAASAALSPALAAAADVNARPAQAQAAPVPLPSSPALSPVTSEKAGCGAVLLIMGKVADNYPDLFAKQNNGKAVQTLLSAFGLKGKAMMDEAFAEGSVQGLSPTQTYEAGVASLMDSVKTDIGSANPADTGKQVGMALMKRCTGIGQ